MDSTNLRPPALGPTRPVYPELAQMLRVTAGPIAVADPGTPPVYPALTQQYDGNLSFRDREPAYVTEPNRVFLAPGYYDCRLVSSHAGLPLYATTCCLPGGSSSSSGSPSAGPSDSSQAPTQRRPLGSRQADLKFNVELPLPQLRAGEVLFGVAAVVGAGAAAATLSFSGTPLGLDVSQALSGGAALPGTLYLFSSAAFGGQSGSLTLSASGGSPATLLIQAVGVVGVAGALDRWASQASVSSACDAGSTDLTRAAPEFAQGAFLMLGAASWSWELGFASGAQDLTFSSGVLTEGYRFLDSINFAEATLGGVAPDSFAGLVATYS